MYSKVTNFNFTELYLCFSEERMSRNMKAIFGDFVAMGTPTTTLDWRPFTADNNIFYELENGITGMHFFTFCLSRLIKTLIFVVVG